MKKKRISNVNPYIRDGIDMNVADIAKELNLTHSEVETALKGIFYKFRKYIKNNNIKKQDYL
jgi:hypothetical protein